MSDSLELIVGRIEGRLTGIEGKLDAALKVHADTLQTHDERIKTLEQFRWKAAGVLALVAFLVPIAVKVLF